MDNKTLELKIITDQEPYSFSHLLNMKKQSQDYNYIKNNQHVYYRGLKIEDADPETFLIMTDIIDGKGCFRLPYAAFFQNLSGKVLSDIGSHTDA